MNRYGCLFLSLLSIAEERTGKRVDLIDAYHDSLKRGSYDFNGLHVIVSPARYEGTEWLHVSFSRKSRIPDYKDIQLVRKDFIGTDKKSIMVFPNEEHYVNIAKYCLHLWYSAENPIPDFDADICGMKCI